MVRIMKHLVSGGSIHRTDYVRLHEISYRGRSGDDMGFVYQEFLYTNKIEYVIIGLKIQVHYHGEEDLILKKIYMKY
ncbi:hypothetical protein KF146HA_01003 [Lactococcus lactis]|jgi:hypothetical protein|nr:Hexosyltransferase [Lactococcus lactis subsp. lactis]MDU0397535.1 hypothetical protein [Lactococcus lactis]